MRKLMFGTMVMVVSAMLAACGGGGGGGGTAEPTKAIVKLSTVNAGSQIGGVDVIVALPTGVTVKGTPPNPDTGVVVQSGQAISESIVLASYTAATGTQAGTVHVGLASSSTNGFGTGEFATINCDLAAGVKPSSSDFTIVSAIVSDISTSTPTPVPGASVTASVTLE